MTTPTPTVLWTPQLGAWPADGGFRFRVWAPGRQRVELVIGPRSPAERRHTLEPSSDGVHSGLFDAANGERYAYLLDGEGPFPDPASRSQPDGVHAPSALVDPRAFRWSDATWRGVPLDDLIIYEAHVGTFSPEGTYAGLVDRLEYLSQLGVTAVELMPVADFPGRRNWGYDGVDLFAPARCYGSPDDLRRLVDAAHHHGMAVLLDVVYNHFGPDGAYLAKFSPYYFSSTHHTPWGRAVNLDGPHAGQVRSFFIENALHWIHEYHMDGLRLDATHALIDDSARHFLQELTERVHASVDTRHVALVAEDDRNLAVCVTPVSEGGWGLDAMWSDDVHHQVRRLTAGDADGYFQDYSGSTHDLATTIRRGWFYSGQHSNYRGQPRGTDPAGVPLQRIVICLQNHDQVGNRAFGERLSQQIDPAVFRALTALLLFAPETPLLFMGQEWAASSPFLYFTDHEPELGTLVTRGRRAEFSKFSAFADPRTRERIPDPQADSTFAASRLDWPERAREPHAGIERLYRTLIALRKQDPAFRDRSGDRAFEVAALDADSLGLIRRPGAGLDLLMIVRLRGAGMVDAGAWDAIPAGSRWRIDLTTEAAAFADAPQAPAIEHVSHRLMLHFSRPAAAILRKA
ncbi:MAG: malto-oligosyltrehalose trehalohydrolase [Acidobacteria bacterium]|nr:MAG: malto-oligosyltrehalose trehalohydrolase [Acidobacteriota bacterium]